ncbi:MAG: RagB/SusD family nutrient uptake outer membrane protein [Bacteroidales bacterium]|nr:RagB/SusD family nutrient uptake outer membrane protein [Bacteroidales bacterium]
MKKIFILFTLALLAVSCTEALDKFPLDKLSDANFFSNEDGLKAYSNTFYSVFPGAGSYESATLCCLDQADSYFRNKRLDAITGNRIPASSGTGDWDWVDLRKFNTLLDNLGQCEDKQVAAQYEGLARFFRAYFYFEKVKRYGNVPWYDTQLGSDDPALYKTQDSRDMVINNVLKDLDCAIEQLGRTREIYTVTAWTAMALKSRVCLFEGTFQKYHNSNSLRADSLLNQCAEASLRFIRESGYSLYNTGTPEQDYFDLFTAGDYMGSPTTTEVILARNYSITYKATHRLHACLLTSGEGASGMSRKAVASYLNRDGSRFTDKEGWEKTQFKDELTGRDPRLAQSIRYPGYTRIGGTAVLAPDLANCVTGYQPIKFLMTEDGDVHGQSYGDLILFRAAEVYLNYAEAKAELGTITNEDLDLTVNAIRKRAGIADAGKVTLQTPADPFLTDSKWGGYTHTTDAVILEIRRERLCELNQEGFRYYDLMRWKEGNILTAPYYGMYFPGPGEYDLTGDNQPDVCLYTDTKPTTTAPVSLKIGEEISLSEGESGMIDKFKGQVASQWDENRDYLFPLPLQELRYNENLIQNPGWPDGRGQ